MLDLIIDYESEGELPGPAYRRYITRLAGTDHNEQFTEDEWEPQVGWTDSFRNWLGYDWDNYYCGDGDDTFHLFPPNPDGSSMTSADCIAEDFIKNTDCGAIAVFAGSNSSGTDSYDLYGRGILEAVYCDGITRVGDAVQRARLEYLYYFWNRNELAQFNLLGDPAVDIGDRVKFRDCCDLIVSPADLAMNRYPTLSLSGGSGEPELQVIVRNAGAVASGYFEASLEITYGEQVWTSWVRCNGLDPGEEETLQFVWHNPPSGVSGEIHLSPFQTLDLNALVKKINLKIK